MNEESRIQRLRRVAAWLTHRDPGVLAPLEWALSRRPVQGPSPMIVVGTIPRSGSTLLVQLLAHALEVNYLSNFHYMLYRHPYAASWLGRRLLRPYTSQFRSYYGNVPGANGPAEGERFWSYWLDQELTDHPPAPDSARVAYIQNFFRWLYAETERPFVVKYVGHTYHLADLARRFPDAVVVCLRRDLVSVGQSFLTARARRPTTGAWWTMRPRECGPLDGRSPHEDVATQVFHLENRLREQETRLPEGVLAVDYRELCAEPAAVLARVQAALAARGFPVRRRPTAIPESFAASSREGSDDRRRIADVLETLTSRSH